MGIYIYMLCKQIIRQVGSQMINMNIKHTHIYIYISACFKWPLFGGWSQHLLLTAARKELEAPCIQPQAPVVLLA